MPHAHHRRRHLAVALPIFTLLAIVGQAAADQPSGDKSPAAAARESRIAAQLALHPNAVPMLADWSGGLPFYSIRTNAEGFASDPVSRSLENLSGTPIGAAARDARNKLIASIPELRIDTDPAFGTPQFVRSTFAFLTGASKASPAQVAAQYIRDHAALFEIDAAEIAKARVERDYRTDHNSVTHLTFQQQFRGLDLVGCSAIANVASDGRLINIGSSMLPRPAGDFVAPAFQLSPAAAIAAAARHAGVALAAAPQPLAAPKPADTAQLTTWTNPPELRPDEPVVTSRTYFAVTREDIRAAYNVTIPVRGPGHTYDIVVDAADGSLLWRHDRLVWDSTQPITFRTYTSDSVAPMSPSLPTPSSTQAPEVPRTLFTVVPAQVTPFSLNGWIDDNIFETIGNNVDAHLDRDANNSPDLPRPNGGASRTFDFPLDLTQSPLTYGDASCTHLFYLANDFHDRLYAMGFTETARNFQLDNFGRGGTGNDRINADCQDGASLATPNANNANFSTTGADGSGGRVQMYLFNGANPDRDGSFDGDIVYHEMAHGLSIRLHAGLSGTQSGGQGEGWSDFFGICLLAEASDDPNANYITGGYATYLLATPTYTTNYYYGIRRFPYSVNLNINPLTLASMDTAQYSVPVGVPVSPLVGVALSTSASEVHNTGEIWCNTLLECRAALWNRDGFSGNQLIMQLVVDGMKLGVQGGTTFLQSRDSLLQADMVNRANADRFELWTAFAKRGFGVSATVPAATATGGVVQAFDTPFTAIFTYPDGLPTQLLPGVVTNFRVNIVGSGVTLTPATASITYRVNNGPPMTAVLTPTGNPDEFTAALPAADCFQRVTFSIQIGTSLGDRVSPLTGAYSASVFTSITTVQSDSFESDTGWTVFPTTATTGAWVRVDPNGTAAAPEDDHTDAPGVACWVTGQGTVGGALGAADVDGGLTVLNSPAFDLSALPDAQVSYWRWYSTGSSTAGPYTDTFRVEASSNNGSTWTTAEIVGPASSPDTNPGWRFASWKLSQLGLVPSSQVKVRFIAEDTNPASVVEAALDDFKIEVVNCVQPTGNGSCCDTDGACAVTTAAACTASFTVAGVCTPNPCTQPTAACCAGTACSIATASDCATAGGAFQPFGSACGPIDNPTTCCPANFNQSGGTTVQDIFDFLAAYFANVPTADFNLSGGITVQDIFDFLSAYFTGCA